MADCWFCEDELELELVLVLELEPEDTVWPFELMTATLAKSVFSPNTALNASAWAPVPTGALFAAVIAD